MVTNGGPELHLTSTVLSTSLKVADVEVSQRRVWRFSTITILRLRMKLWLGICALGHGGDGSALVV